MALYSEIDSSVKLVSWIKRKLGYPKINIEISDEQILDNIADAVQYFQRYSGDIKFRNALIIDLAAGVDTYALNSNVINIIDFDTTQSLGGSITTLFSAENLLFGAGSGVLGSLYSPDLVSWDLALQNLELTKNRLVRKFDIDFNKFTSTIKFTPKPDIAMTGVLTVYSYWDHNVKSTIWNEIWIKKYSLALTKITLGQIWSKFSGMPIPGGATLDGAGLKAEGITERDFLESDIIAFEMEPAGFYIG